MSKKRESNPNIVRSKKRDSQNKSAQKKRKPTIFYEDQKQKQRVIVRNAIFSGFNDARKHGVLCIDCKKIKIKFEKYDDDDVDFCITKFAIDKTQKRISWSPRCVACSSQYTTSRNNDPANFQRMLEKTVRYHIKGDTDVFRKTVNIIRERDNDACRLCGVQTLPQTKSGWKQLTINDMHPDRREFDKTANIDDIACSCFACNSFQNKLSWHITKQALSIISNIHPIKLCVTGPDFYSTLSSEELEWFHKSGNGKMTYTTKVAIINRDKNVCQLTGVTVVYKKGEWNTASYDRHDSRLPYTIENTHIVAKHVNFVKKGTVTINQFNEWLAHVRDIRKE